MDDEKKQLVMDFMTTFTSEGGARVLDNLSKFCYENESTYKGTDTHGTAFQEGARSVILYIRSQLKKDLHEVKQKEARS